MEPESANVLALLLSGTRGRGKVWAKKELFSSPEARFMLGRRLPGEAPVSTFGLSIYLDEPLIRYNFSVLPQVGVYSCTGC